MAFKFPDAQQVVAEHNALLVAENLEPKIDLIISALRQYGVARVFLCQKLCLPEVEKEGVRIETSDPHTALRLITNEAKAAGYDVQLSVNFTSGDAAMTLRLPSNNELD